MIRQKYDSQHGSPRSITGTGSKTAEANPDPDMELVIGNAPSRIQPNQITACPDAFDVECWLDIGEWAMVKSSNVAAIAYNRDAEELYVEFIASGKGASTNPIYSYHGVPQTIARGMFMANSMGKYVWEVLRGKYPYKKIRG